MEGSIIYNQDLYFLNLGRKATTAALIGLIAGIVFAIFLSFSKVAVLFSGLILSYLAVSSFWGVYYLERWFKKYRYQMPIYIWYFLNFFIIIFGLIVGILGYGFIEHFLLVLAIEQQKDNLGLISAQIILLPYFGEKYAEKIDYH